MANTTYNYWTANGSTAGADTPSAITNPGTASLPLVNTPELAKFSQVLLATGEVNSGTPSRIGNYTSYWLSTPYDSSYGHKFTVNNSVIAPVSGYVYAQGNSIRCVRL